MTACIRKTSLPATRSLLSQPNLFTMLRTLLILLLFSTAKLWAAPPLLSDESFLEPQTPFLRSALSFKDGDEEIRVRRGVIIPLRHDDLWACFDPDLLRWVAVWQAPKGESPISYDSMAAVSFPDKKAKAKRPPVLRGKILLTFPPSPLDARLRDDRTEHLNESERAVGPQKGARWEGISFSGKTPILHYAGLSERVSATEKSVFVRTILTANQQLPGRKNAPQQWNYSHDGQLRVTSLPPEPTQPPLPIFPETVTTQNSPNKLDGPYSVRNITFPEGKRPVRATDLAFLSSGVAILVTLDGDVWRVEDIEKESSQWTRVATGLFEPMSLTIANDQIFVLGRDQITELVDTNGDHHFDRFRNASDLFQQTMHTRDYATSLEVGSDGSFYIGKGGIFTADRDKGVNRENSVHRGAILRLTDKRVDVLADGLRLPFVGLRGDGTVFASDQQGQFIPSSPLHLISKQKPFLGFPPSNHRHLDNLTKPLLWYPYQANRSSAGFATTSSLAFPDTPDQFLQVSWNGRLFSINTPEVGRPFSWMLPLQLDFPSLNAATHPLSGKLYAVGLGISGYKPTTPEFVGLASIEQTTPFPSPLALDVAGNRVGVIFNRPLSATETIVPGKPTLRLFDIKRTPQYGSGHYKWDGEPGEQQLQPKSYSLSPDRQRLTLNFESLFRSEMFDLQLTLSSGSVTGTIHLYTRPSHLSPATPANLRALAEAEQSKPELLPGNAEVGKPLFTQYACIGCHSLEGAALVGPPLNEAGLLEADYLRESILTPAAKIAEGYEPSMPSFSGVIPDQDLVHLIAYLQTLK